MEYVNEILKLPYFAFCCLQIYVFRDNIEPFLPEMKQNVFVSTGHQEGF